MNIYALSGLLIAVTSGLMTLLMFFIGKKKLHYLWALFCFSVFIFGFGIYFIGGAVSPDAASFWWKVSHIGAILIPILFLHFVCEFLEIRKTKILFFLYTVSIILLVTDLTGGLFINKMRFVFDQFYYDSPPEPFYVLFTIMFFGLTAYSHLLLWKGYKQSKDILIKNKIKFFFFGMGVSFAGGAFNFLPVYGIDIYPYMNLTVFLYPLIISYAIFKHQLFDIKLVVVDFAVLLLNLFLFINIFASSTRIDLILNGSVFALIFVFSIVLLRGIYKDIRDREKAEQLVVEMTASNEKLRTLERQKTEFVSIASHQLRTPLTVIRGYASMVLEGTFGNISAGVREAMEKLYKSSEKIQSIVEDLLTVSRIEQGRQALNFKTQNIIDLVKDLCAEFDEQAKEKRIIVTFSVEPDTEIFVSVDENKFMQVVRHLLENAIQYTNEGGTVRIVLQNDEITKMARLLISDTGVGMSREQISAIFERSKNKIEKLSGESNADSDTTILGHTKNSDEVETTESDTWSKRTPGIGLYIAEEIIEAHHGNIRIESAGLGNGSTVILEIPRVA